MIRLSVSVLVALTLFLYIQYSGTMKVSSSHEEWAKIVSVELVIRNQPKLGVGGTYSYWLADVILSNGRLTQVRVSFSPAPQANNCLPIIVEKRESNQDLIIHNAQKWRFGEVKTYPCSDSPERN